MPKAKGPYSSISDIKRANREYAKRTGRAYWFGPSEMGFFNTRIHGSLVNGRYFITSERMDERFPWKYSVRKGMDDGRIETIGDFGRYDSEAKARAAAKKLSTENPGRRKAAKRKTTGRKKASQKAELGRALRRDR